MNYPKIKNSIKSISNIDDFYLQLIQIIPKISKTINKTNYYFILVFEDNLIYKTDPLTNYSINSKLSINISNYLRKNKNNISITGEQGQDYIIDDITIQDLLNIIIEDTTLFYYDKFNNIYYCNQPYSFHKENNYYSSILFTKYFKLREYIDDIYITINKQKRSYNKRI